MPGGNPLICPHPEATRKPLRKATSDRRKGTPRSEFRRLGIPAAALLLAGLLAACRATPPRVPDPGPEDARLVLDRIAAIVRDDFVDRAFGGLDWEAETRVLRSRLDPDTPDDELRDRAEALLSRLGRSHTALYTPSDPTYFALRSVFARRVDAFPFPQIGAWLVPIEGRWFIRDVFTDTVAERSGLRRGDEIAAADGAPVEPVRSFEERDVTLSVRRREAGPIETVTVRPVRESVQRTHLRATRRSARILEHEGVRIGYFRLWSGTHDAFRRTLHERAWQWADRVDVFLLDLRGGFGGAHPGFVDPFFGDERGRTVFAGPMVVLIDAGTRSGKEWVAHVLRDRPRTTLVGTTTRGAFVAGRPYVLAGGRFLLYLAVAPGPDGIDLEGIGVPPDVRVEAPLPFAAGADPQLERALEIAVREARA